MKCVSRRSPPEIPIACRAAGFEPDIGINSRNIPATLALQRDMSIGIPVAASRDRVTPPNRSSRVRGRL